MLGPGKRQSLSVEILFNLVIVMVFSILLISILLLKSSRDLDQANLFREHEQQSLNLKYYFESMSGVIDRGWLLERLKLYLDGLWSSQKGLAIVLYDLSSDRPEILYERNVEGKESEKIHGRLADLIRKGDGPAVNRDRFFWSFGKIKSLESAIPLKSAGFNAALYIRTSSSSSERGLFGIKITVIVFTVVFALVVVVFGYSLLLRKVIRPLNSISRKAKAIADGYLDVTMDEYDAGHENEIGILARSIKTMTDRLVQSQKELVGNLAELTELNRALKQAQMEIVRAEKLASIGRLSSGIAHEIGNPLSAVMGYVDILKRESKKKDAREMLERASSELGRISIIIRQLLEYSQPARSEPGEIDMAQSVEGALESLRIAGAFDRVALEAVLKGGYTYKIDDTQLRQIVSNLVKNACDAVNDKFGEAKGGKVVVCLARSRAGDLKELKDAVLFNTERRKDDPPGTLFIDGRRGKRRSDPEDSDSYRKRSRTGFDLPEFLYDPGQELIKLTVEDNGIGIKKEDVFKIFEPFYTTKDPGKGTGLGLYMTLNIVGSMGGYIDLLSEYGQGSLFMVLFPLEGQF